MSISLLSSYKMTFLTMLPIIVSLLCSCYASAAVLPSSPLFPLEIFGSRNTNSKALRQQWQQATLQNDHDPDRPRFSPSDFPGDETGDSPFFYCPESDSDTDIFEISKIVLNPNPPRINHIFVFHAHGNFREEIFRHGDGPFRVRCTVRNEDRDGLDFTFESDFCDFVSMMEMDGRSTGCPPLAGNGTIHKFEFVDFGISEGNYSLKIDVRGNGKRVFCVQSWFDLTRVPLVETGHKEL